MGAGDTPAAQRVKIVTSDAAGSHFLGTNADPLIESDIDGQKATYSFAINGLAIGLTPTDIFTITGSATKTVRVTRLEFTATATAGTTTAIILLKRSTADTGGTSSTLTMVPHDSSDAAATAVVRGYTANPTLGTLVGNIRAFRSLITAVSAGTTSSPPFFWDFGMRTGHAIVLRGTGDVLAINLNSVTLTGGTFDIAGELTEE